jgi:AraC family transcriptional regulator
VKIEVAERRPVKVACLRHTGPTGASLGRFWRATVAPWLADLGLIDCPRYGVTLEDCGSAPGGLGRTRYGACVELPPGLFLPGAAEITIPGGRYAITAFKGTAAEIDTAWEEFGAAVLALPGNVPDNLRQRFEHHPRGASYDARTGVFNCELCLPLKS